MRSYAEREIFTDEEQATWCDAVDIVNRVSKRWDNELRCHELARAVASQLALLDRRVEVVDGKLFAIEHSWLVIPPQGAVRQRAAILDVYCPGRIPQVQLIDQHFIVARGYEPGPDRTDLRYDVLTRLRDEIAKGPGAL